MRFRSIALRAASTVTILGTALGTGLISAPAQASGSGAPTGPHPSAAGAAHTALQSQRGVITGVVDGVGGRPLTGACVMAAGPAGSALAVTRSDGRYVLGGLRPGRYTLHYSACAAGGHYVDQWSGGALWPGGAAPVTIGRGQERELAAVTLRTTLSAAAVVLRPAVARLISGVGTSSRVAGLRSVRVAVKAGGPARSAGTGAIAGTVTGGGKPLKGICVLAAGPSYRSAETTKTGQYQITKLRPGRYFVVFAGRFCGKNAGDWLEQIYKGINGPAFRGKLTRVPVSAGQTTGGIDAALNLGGEISGTVRGEGGKGVRNVCVYAEGKDGRDFVYGFNLSGKNGTYTLHSLYPGKYQVQFIPYCGSKGNYIPQWWRDTASFKHATTIVVTKGHNVRGVDAALRPGAILSGVVRGGSPHGALLKGICVVAIPIKVQNFYEYFQVVTRKDGSYRLAGMTTGKYRVYFFRGCGNNGNYLQVQRIVSVVAGHRKVGFDTVLPFGAIMTGTVTDSHGAPVGGICVDTESGNSYGSAVTKADGTYSIIALGTGRYTVSFQGGCGNHGSYAPQYYRGQTNVGSANAVSATAGHTTAGVDATMRPGGTITGVVTDATKTRLNRICIQVASPSVTQFGFYYNFQFTNKNGIFTARNLTPGDYLVNFNCFFGTRKFATQWFMDQPGSGTADAVSAPAGVVTSGINAVLQSGGFIEGVLTNGAGKPLGGQCVEVGPHGSAFPSYPFFSRSVAYTNSHGVYRVGPLAAAKYDVLFDCDQIRYASQWYKGTAARASATPVSVANGATTTGISGVLTVGGSISGQVTAAGNRPQQNVCVDAADSSNQSFGFGYTNRQGRYTIRSLSSGSYELTFYDCGYGRHHVLLGTVAKEVNVVAPQAVTGVNQQLFPAGSISGHVNGGPGATPQANVCVVADPVNANDSYQYTQTDEHGNYRLTGLASGPYQVYFGDSFCPFSGTGYAPQWYKDVTSQGAATNVTVTSGRDTPAIDATLGSDGAISGSVTSHGHGNGRRDGHAPVAGECVTATPVAPVPDPAFNAVPNPVVGVTGAGGTYLLLDLQPGKYTVKFSAGCGDSGFQTQWWHRAMSAARATVITVTANRTATGIDADLRH